jgi:hypothetical protein
LLFGFAGGVQRLGVARIDFIIHERATGFFFEFGIKILGLTFCYLPSNFVEQNRSRRNAARQINVGKREREREREKKIYLNFII